ncbi:MAG TPA: hypothetical protein VGO47_00005 [Chlamydiales bacterium]|jgi:hypothetical protein|nr:hypothetical protein [Chlamydiales bacterium]
MQRIPWPTSDDIMNGVNQEDKRWLGHDTWLLNDEDFPWLKATDGVFIKHFTFASSNAASDVVVVENIVYSRMNMELWLTSDGRAYFVHFSEDMISSKSNNASQVCFMTNKNNFCNLYAFRDLWRQRLRCPLKFWAIIMTYVGEALVCMIMKAMMFQIGSNVLQNMQFVVQSM